MAMIRILSVVEQVAEHLCEELLRGDRSEWMPGVDRWHRISGESQDGGSGAEDSREGRSAGGARSRTPQPDRWDSHPVVRRIVRWAADVSCGKEDLRQTLTPAEFVPGGSVGPAADF